VHGERERLHLARQHRVRLRAAARERLGDLLREHEHAGHGARGYPSRDFG
jgi:hypothetical protein